MQWYIPQLPRLLGITSQTHIKHIKSDVATLDSKTSPICQEMDGKHFPMKDFKAGLTAPPFHCWCRSCTCPYFDDEFSEGGMRAARGADGESYYVPDDMSYDEWKKSFVDGGDKDGLTPNNISDIMSVDGNVFYTKDDPMRDIFGSSFDSNPLETQKMLENFEDLGVEVIYRSNVMSYQPSPISGLPGQVVIDKNASYSAWIHEQQHVFDDRDSGWAGFKNYFDINTAIQFEVNAYDVEIELAKSHNLDDVVQKLEALKEESRRNLLGS